MILEIFIAKNSGDVALAGGDYVSTIQRLGDTLDLVIGFLDDAGNVVEMPAGTLGELVLKRYNRPDLPSRLNKAGWTQSGSGASRRYTITTRVYSDTLLADLIADPAAAFALHVVWTAAGKPYVSQGMPCTFDSSFVVPGDILPMVPTVGFPVEWSREVFGPAEDVVTATRYVGNINLGGPITEIRLSVEDWATGLYVQLTHNGTDIFTAPVMVTGQTMLLAITDDPARIALATLTAGARIEAETTFDSDEYSTAVKGLQVEIQVTGAERSALTAAPAAAFDWIVARLLAGDGIELESDPEAQTITFNVIPAAPLAHAASHATGGADPLTLAQSQITGLTAALAALAPLASPALTGNPTAPTQDPGNDSTRIATTAFVQAAQAALIAAAPSQLNTLNELAAALGNDANFAATLTTALGLKAPIASPAFSGNPTAPTQTPGNDSTRLATTAFVQAAIVALGTIGSAAAQNVGISAGNVVQLDGTGKLPAVDGSQLTNLPSTGGGASLLHVSGLIQGHTTAAIPASAPACTIECAAWNGTGGVLTIIRNAETMVVTLDTTDPANGSVFLDTTSLSNPADFAPALNSALAAFSAEFTTAYDSDTKIITLTAVLTGGAITLSASITGSTGLATPTGTSGGDESPATGAIMAVELVPAVAGKITTPLRVAVKSSLGVSVKLRDETGNDFLPFQSSTGGAWAEWSPDASTLARFFAGTEAGESLSFCFTDATTGGTAEIRLIADQIDAP